MGNPFQLAAPASGPKVVLDFDMRRQYAGEGPRVVDIGDIRIQPGESIDSYGKRISLVTSLILDRGAVPAMLGGDHSVTHFTLDAILRRYPALGIIHFDAHHDMWPVAGGQFHYTTHATPFGHALEHDSVKVLFQLGLRVLETVEGGKLREDPRVSYRSARELQTLTPEEALAGLPRDIPYYLSFDIDAIDPMFASETGTTLGGGLTPYQAMNLVDYAAREFRLVGWDIVEVAQREDRTNRAAMVASMLVKQLVLARVPFEPLRSYRRDA